MIGLGFNRLLIIVSEILLISQSKLIVLSFSKKQTLDDAYAAPANFLEIDVINPITHGIGNKRYTDYECRLKVSNCVRGVRSNLDDIFKLVSYAFQTNLPVFRVKESSVRRRFSDFEWLRNELERDSKVSSHYLQLFFCS
jgi:sorting nexin-3/12